MTFIHGYLLGGLVLAGLPVLLHLLMRQKPRRLSFPAFRFLQAKQRINQRKIRLQHLLLLLLRVAVIVALCLALARPRIFASRTGGTGDRAVVAIVLIDTSASMSYSVSGVTRLQEASLRARELLDEMTDSSRVALLDSGDDARSVFLPRGEVRRQLDSLRLRPAAGSLNLSVERALRMLESVDADEGTPRLLYVFTDRTRAAWDTTGVVPKVPDGVTVMLVDVGVDAPRDLDIDSVEIFPPIVAPGSRFEVRVSLRATPTGHENELACILDTGAEAQRILDRRPVVLTKGVTSSLVVFEPVAPQVPAGQTTDVTHQITVRIMSRDALAINNGRHATFLVRGNRRLLMLVESHDRRTLVWEAVLDATRSFSWDVRTFEEADKLTPQELSAYSVMALFEVTAVPDGWWKKLAEHTRAGGGLAIVPGGSEMTAGREVFNRTGLAVGVLPAPLDQLVSVKEPLYWKRFSGGHPLMKPFVDWSRRVDPDFARDDLRPFVRRYWQLGPLPKGAMVVASYANSKEALVERDLGKGKVVLFTTPLDLRLLDPMTTAKWTNYWDYSSFGLVLTDRVCRYLGGEVRTPDLNFICGQVPQVSLPAGVVTPLSLSGPGLAKTEKSLKAPAPDTPLALPQATMPGNYLILDGRDKPIAGVSLNLSARETVLERIPLDELEKLFGKGSVIQPGQAASLSEVLAQARPAPLELLPALMMALLVVLTVESLLANRFYKRPTTEGIPPSIRQMTAELTAKGTP